MEYEITLEDGRKYKFVEDKDGQWVKIFVNDKLWGCSDGNRFIKALLKEIQKLNTAIDALQELL